MKNIFYAFLITINLFASSVFAAQDGVYAGKTALTYIRTSKYDKWTRAHPNCLVYNIVSNGKHDLVGIWHEKSKECGK